MKGDSVDAVSGATPLAKMKFGHEMTDWPDLFFGNTSGCIGETSIVLILLAGLYLAYRGLLNWRIPIGIFITVAALTTLVYFIDPQRYPTPQFMLLAGGLFLGAVYMATDLVTSPLTTKGNLDLRLRNRSPGVHHSSVGRVAGRGDVRHFAHECRHATN